MVDTLKLGGLKKISYLIILTDFKQFKGGQKNYNLKIMCQENVFILKRGGDLTIMENSIKKMFFFYWNPPLSIFWVPTPGGGNLAWVEFSCF